MIVPRSTARGFAKGARRQLFEYWAHEASLLPLRLHPLLRWRMDRARRYVGHTPARVDAHRKQRAYYRAILKEVERRGPIAASDLEDPGERSGPWWGWHQGKGALERLFHTGEVTSAGRRGGFERVYDLTERVIPSEILALPTPSERDAIRELAAAGRALSASPPKPTSATISACRWPRPAALSPNWRRRAR